MFDGTSYSNTATVALTVTPVNDVPVADAGPDGIGVQLRDVSFHGTATDVEGQSLVYSWHFGDGGTAAGPDAVHQYATPGTYTATLTVTDPEGGVGTDTRVVTVRALNPTAGNDGASTNEDAVVTVAVLANDTNPAGPSDPLVITAVTQGTFGAVAVNADGTLTYTPAANANGTDTFTYTVRNGDAGTATATVTVTVAAVNDAPLATPDAYSVNEDTTLTVAAPGVRANDIDIDGDALSVAVASGPSHGALALNADGSFAYTPTANYHGSDSFTYTLSDGHGGTATGTVNITVNSVNDAPVAATNSYTATGGTLLSVAVPGVLQNDTDADGDALTAVLVSGPAHGTLTLNPNGSFTYTPTAGFTGTDTFTYRAGDGTATSTPVAVSISVTGGGTGATLVPDPCDPAKTSLVVRGTAGNDTIVITPSGNSGAVVVKLNGTTLGTFNPTGRVIAYGLSGDDDIQTAGAITRLVWLHGGTGNDRLKGGAGNDVLLGEDGNDLLTGAGGRDLLIGGEGADRIVGNDQDDILIAGFTQFDANDHALCAIMDEWTSCRNFAVRVLNLWSGLPCVARANGNVFLNTTTVHDDGMEDILTGSAGYDWFLFNADGDGGVRDRVTDMSLVEWLFAADIDFIYVDPT